jgi:hypothetical protein
MTGSRSNNTCREEEQELLWARERRADAMSPKHSYNIVRRGYARHEGVNFETRTYDALLNIDKV